MKTVILACRTLEPEVRLAMKTCGCSYRLEVLQENNHDVPRRLRQNLQQKLDEMQDVDRVLLAFTTCGGSIVGLHTGDFEMVIPRTDDCLSLLLGSAARRKAVQADGFGLFVTQGWLDHEKNAAAELDRIRKKYDPEVAESVIRAMYGHFTSLNVVDTGAYDVQALLLRTEKLAQALKLEHRIVPGTLRYLKELLQGPHDPTRFLVIPPRSAVAEQDVL